MNTWACILVILFGMTLVYNCAASDKSKLTIVEWNGKDNKTECFSAHMAIVFYAQYNKTGSVGQANTSFISNDELAVKNCNATYLEMVINSTKTKHVLTLIFEADDKNYWLASAEMKFDVSNVTYVNSTDVNKTVTAKSAFKSRLTTPLGSSYSCAMESQFALNQNDSSIAFDHMYLRFAVNEKEKIKMQALNMTKDPKEYKCFSDMPLPEASVNSWDVTDNKTKCALMNTSLKLMVMYKSIAGMDMTAMIPLTAATKFKEGKCSTNKTTITLSVENDAGTLSFVFMTKASSFYYSSDDMYSLDTVTLTYHPDGVYFPNHESDKDVVETQSKLALFSAPVGKSYRCDALTEANVTKTFKAMFNSTRLQPFAVENSTFSDASNCAAEPTTQPITTKPIIPIITNPNITDRVIKDSNVTCLHAHIGLQFQTNYKVKGSNVSAVARFNFNQGEVTQTAICNGTSATVTFENKKYVQTLTLTFSKNSKTGVSQLSNVMLDFNITNYFANASETGQKRHYSADVSYFELQKNTSYLCKEAETDILLDNKDRVILRIVGLQIEPFPLASQFAPARKCFSDLPAQKVNEGSWYINETTKNSSSICAHFNFASYVNISYPTLLSDEPVFVKIPIDGMKHNASESFGKCEANVTTLMLDLDNGKMKFTFTFNKKNITKTDFRYSMTDFKMVYDLSSEYFPNHDYVEGGMVTLTNQSLDLFETNQDHSYKCDAKSVAYLNKTKMAVTFTDVQVQPFGVNDDGSFLTADDCADDKSKLSKTARIGILAAIIVVALALFIGVGCFAYRKFKGRNKSGYQAFK